MGAPAVVTPCRRTTALASTFSRIIHDRYEISCALADLTAESLVHLIAGDIFVHDLPEHMVAFVADVLALLRHDCYSQHPRLATLAADLALLGGDTAAASEPGPAPADHLAQPGPTDCPAEGPA